MVCANAEYTSVLHIVHAYYDTRGLVDRCWFRLREWPHFILFRKTGFGKSKSQIEHPPHHLFDIFAILDWSDTMILPEIMGLKILLFFNIAFWVSFLCYIIATFW